MKRAGIALAVSTLLASPSAGQERPVFRAEVGLVLLQATVKNTRGELVTDLEREAFTVYENGKAQAVSLFRRDDVPVSLGIVLDTSGSMREKRKSMEAAALAFVRASNPRDEVFVLNFGDKPSLDVPFTRDLGVLEAGIHRDDCIGGTALRDATLAAEAHLAAHAAYDRKVLLMVTDGRDNASLATSEHVREEARRSGTTIYAIGLLADDEPGKARRARHDLDEITEETGGIAYYPQPVDEIGGIALALARQIRSRYTIGYTPANQALDGSYRRIRVVAKGEGRLVVRTRAGYQVAPAAAPRPRPPAQAEER